MVLSRIDPNVSYPELKKVDKEDKKKETTMYQTELRDVDCMIALGKVKDTFQSQNILYFPIYLVRKDHHAVQVGVYEIPADQYSKYIGEEDSNILISKMDAPLLYGFATKSFFLENRLQPEIPLRKEVSASSKEKSQSKAEDDQDDDKKEEENFYEYYHEIPKERKDIFTLTKIPLPPLLKEESKRKAKEIRSKYKETKEDTWVQKFMQNRHYEVLQNEGGGDCLFAVIRDAFSSIGQHTSVQKLRNKLAQEISDEVFTKFKNMYDELKRNIARDVQHIKELEKEYIEIKEKFLVSQDREEKQKLEKKGKEIKKEHDQFKEERQSSLRIFSEFKFMKDVEDVQQFKEQVKKCEFYANPWALQTLEEILNIKLIVLSSETYSQKDLKNILQCGEVSPLMESKGKFQPEFYIIVQSRGDDHNLIAYRKKQILKFVELPYDLKKMIAEKCMETKGGLFRYIPEVQQFQSTLESSASSTSDTESVASTSVFEDILESKLRGLYDDNVVFQFYSKSLDKPVPGKGSGEKIPNERLLDFKTLASIPQWRKKLSNFWIQPFSLDNHQWASVEHYYQGSKFKKTAPEFYLSFSLDSNTPLSKDPLMAKAAGGKSGKFKGELLRPIQIVADAEFFGKASKKSMYDAQYAKFSQNGDLKDLLLATKDAKLTHFIRGKEPIIFDELMLIREKLKKKRQLVSDVVEDVEVKK